MTGDEIALLGGLHSRAEGETLMRLARDVLHDQAIVEIGAYVGASALWLAAGAASGGGARITCIDPWPDPRPDEPDRDHAARQESALRTFRANMAAFGWPVTALRARSEDVAPMWLQPIGLLWIDGDHSYRAVYADILMWVPHVAIGGWIMLHDYLGDDLTPDTFVARAVHELLIPGRAGVTWSDVAQVDKAWLARRRS